MLCQSVIVSNKSRVDYISTCYNTSDPSNKAEMPPTIEATEKQLKSIEISKAI